MWFIVLVVSIALSFLGDLFIMLLFGALHSVQPQVPAFGYSFFLIISAILTVYALFYGIGKGLAQALDD